MINLDICREWALYKRRIADTPQRISYFFDFPCSPFTYQYHSANGKLFGAVVDKKGNFLSYIQKVEFN